MQFIVIRMFQLKRRSLRLAPNAVMMLENKAAVSKVSGVASIKLIGFP